MTKAEQAYHLLAVIDKQLTEARKKMWGLQYEYQTASTTFSKHPTQANHREMESVAEKYLQSALQVEDIAQNLENCKKLAYGEDSK